MTFLSVLDTCIREGRISPHQKTKLCQVIYNHAAPIRGLSYGEILITGRRAHVWETEGKGSGIIDVCFFFFLLRTMKQLDQVNLTKSMVGKD